MGLERKRLPFEFKAEDVQPDGSFKGYASTFGGKPDSYGDVVVTGAFAKTLFEGGLFGLGIVMLNQHNYEEPIGTYPVLQEDKKGLYVEGQFVMEVQKAREVHALMKAKAIQALSIGYKAVVTERDPKKPDIRYLHEIALAEISPVTFPANTSARITGVKRFEEITDVREFEAALRDAGLTNSEARLVASQCRGNLPLLRDAGGAETILKALRGFSE